MPARMTPDKPSSTGSSSNIPSGDGRRGGGGIGGGIIGALLPLLFRNPKLLIIVVILGALWFFFGGSKGCNGVMDPTADGGEGLMDLFSKGATLDPAQYDKAEVYEPLADNVKNPLPERVSLERFAPPRLNQGSQGSCVAWASAYAARSIIHNQATGNTPDRGSAFSPSFMYNRIKIENSGCQGSYILRAMEDMMTRGAVPFSQFAYNDHDCNARPDEEDEKLAPRYRIKGHQRLSKSDDPNSPVDLLAVKQYLAQGSPVVIGMMVGGSFMQGMQGQEVWRATREDTEMRGFGGHAMCVIGYDDFKLGADGGAFQIMNSWGRAWGRNGIAWVPYDAFGYFTREAYAVYPMGTSAEEKPDRFNIRFGLAIVDERGQPTGAHIALEHQQGRVFGTVSPVPKRTRFKVEVTNNLECYTYVFGEETDGSAYVLFPYTRKHSPYCGTTGMRQFPKDHSIELDDLGRTDVIAILVANQPFDYPDIVKRMNGLRLPGLGQRLAAALGNELLDGETPDYTGGETIAATGPASSNAMAVVLRIDKR